MTADRKLKFLVIRRDNIGDLVCTTPMFAALKAHFPQANISALVNSYNVGVLENNPDVDAIYAYTKVKHRLPGQSAARVYWDRVKLLAHLYRQRFDYTILAGANYLPRALRLARFFRPRHIIGFVDPARPDSRIDMGIPYELPHPMHEVEDVFRLLQPLGIRSQPGALKVVPGRNFVQQAEAALAEQGQEGKRPLVAVHISARKISQRWPAGRFAELIRQLHNRYQAAFLLLWSPGDSSNPLHPGDDGKAREIVQALPDIPLMPYPTHQLGELIGALSLCDSVVCSDGGAMHLAAGLGKPILCFFGKSDSSRWYPWGVPHVLLQRPSREVGDIGVADALDGFDRLMKKAGGGSPR